MIKEEFLNECRGEVIFYFWKDEQNRQTQGKIHRRRRGHGLEITVRVLQPPALPHCRPHRLPPPASQERQRRQSHHSAQKHLQRQHLRPCAPEKLLQVYPFCLPWFPIPRSQPGPQGRAPTAGQGALQTCQAEQIPVYMSSSYPYLSPYDPKTDQKQFRDSDGKVITKQPNVQTNPQSRISYLQNKEFKYVECPPKTKQTTEPSDNQKEPFRTGKSHLEVFNGHYNTYFDAELKKPEDKKAMVRSVSHEGPFKPSCTSKNKDFTPVVYVQEGSGRPKAEKIVKKQNKGEPFRLLKVEHNSKPCPSIALSKVNMLRICR